MHIYIRMFILSQKSLLAEALILEERGQLTRALNGFRSGLEHLVLAMECEWVHTSFVAATWLVSGVFCRHPYSLLLLVLAL